MIEYFGNDQEIFNKAMYFQRKQTEYFNLYESERRLKERLKLTPSYDLEYQKLKKDLDKKIRKRHLLVKRYLDEMYIDKKMS